MPASELNIEDRTALERYLQSQFSPAEEFEVREFEVLTGGVSGRTVRVKLSGGQEWVLKQALPKLRVEADWFADPRRIHREALGMKVLAELTPPGSIPKLIFDDETHHVLGMEAVPRPHENWKTALLAGKVDPWYFRQFGKLLGRIHRRSREKDDELQPALADRSFFEALRLEPYYEYSAAKEPKAAEFLDTLIAETRGTNDAMVHGDYSPKNVLITETHLVLLDHEVVHWGDPAFDVGFAITHFLAKLVHLQHVRPALAEAIGETYLCYRSEFGNGWTAPYEERCVRHTLACLLARVVGRSPLEYLTADERIWQRDMALRMIEKPPQSFQSLFNRFTTELRKLPSGND